MNEATRDNNLTSSEPVGYGRPGSAMQHTDLSALVSVLVNATLKSSSEDSLTTTGLFSAGVEQPKKVDRIDKNVNVLIACIL